VSYPWAIKKEDTGETLPTGTSMLDIFDQIGMGRSLLILGAPGSGKTTMLLELARHLIERARQNETEPIPMVFNLASWTEKLTLAEWLAQELNNLYSVPRKTAPDWVKGNKLLLLLDGLDEVRQESRAKCVEAINAFRKEHGLTSLAVCSRSQDYAKIRKQLSFSGAIQIKPLTSTQIKEYLGRFGNELAGIKQVLDKDTALREMADTPLFLSIMVLAYHNTQSQNIVVSKKMNVQRKHLFDTYIVRMFERPARSTSNRFKKQDVLLSLSWLAHKMIVHKQTSYLLEYMQSSWLSQRKQQKAYKLIFELVIGMTFGSLFILNKTGLLLGLLGGIGIALVFSNYDKQSDYRSVDFLSWDFREASRGSRVTMALGVIFTFLLGLSGQLSGEPIDWLSIGLGVSLIVALINGVKTAQVSKMTLPGEKLSLTIRNFILGSFIVGLIAGSIFLLLFNSGNIAAQRVTGWGLLIAVLLISLNKYGGIFIVKHYILRSILSVNNLLPWRLVPFLDYCTDLIFLRRVGGGYIFVHRLLMERFAAMYKET
jgi:Cdc6-like AAA superfamily ATPase